MVLKPGREAEAEAIFRKWELDFAVIGEVTDTGHMVLEWNGEVVVRHPARPAGRRGAAATTARTSAATSTRPGPGQAARRRAGKHRHRRRPAQADGLARPRQPPLDLGAVRQPGRRRHACSARAATPRWCASTARSKALAMTTDCTPRYCYADPYRRRQAGGRRGLPQPLRGRRQAAGDHQLPQLRQPAAARDHGPDRRLPRRHGRRLPRARLPDRERQRLASTTRARRPAAARRSCRRRRSAASGCWRIGRRGRRSPSRPRARRSS